MTSSPSASPSCSRRRFLQVGTLGTMLNLPQLLQAQAPEPAPSPPAVPRNRVSSSFNRVDAVISTRGI